MKQVITLEIEGTKEEIDAITFQVLLAFSDRAAHFNTAIAEWRNNPDRSSGGPITKGWEFRRDAMNRLRAQVKDQL